MLLVMADYARLTNQPSLCLRSAMRPALSLADLSNRGARAQHTSMNLAQAPGVLRACDWVTLRFLAAAHCICAHIRGVSRCIDVENKIVK